MCINNKLLGNLPTKIYTGTSSPTKLQFTIFLKFPSLALMHKNIYLWGHKDCDQGMEPTMANRKEDANIGILDHRQCHTTVFIGKTESEYAHNVGSTPTARR